MDPSGKVSGLSACFAWMWVAKPMKQTENDLEFWLGRDKHTVLQWAVELGMDLNDVQELGDMADQMLDEDEELARRCTKQTLVRKALMSMYLERTACNM